MNLLFLTQPAEVPQGGGWGMLIMWAIAIIAMYVFLIMPQKKRQKQITQMQANIKTGDNIVTTSGFYGVVIDVMPTTVIVEFGNNRNMRIPLQKEAIGGISAPVLTDKEEAK